MNIEDIQKTVLSMRKSHEAQMKILTDKFLEHVGKELSELPETGLELYRIIYQDEFTCPIDLRTGKMGELIPSQDIPNREACINIFSDMYAGPEISVIVNDLLTEGCSCVYYDEDNAKIYPCIDIKKEESENAEE